MPFGGLIRSVVNPVNIGLALTGPGGWAALAMRTITSQIGMNFLQQLGQQMGLPQQAIDLAQATFASTMGQPGLARQNLSQAISGIMQGGFSAREVAQTQRQAESLQDMFTEMMLRDVRGEDEEGGAGAGESRLVRLALALGQVMDSKMDEMIEIGEAIDGTDDTGKLSAQMQALSQELGLVASALNNTIKSIGEANTNMARKN